MVMVEGQEARALLDSGSQLSAISLKWVKKLKLKNHNSYDQFYKLRVQEGWKYLIWVM